MFLERIKPILCLMLAILLISISANVFALNQATDNDNNEMNETPALESDYKSMDLEVESETISNEDPVENTQRTEIITEDLPIEKIDPSTIFDEYPELKSSSNANPMSYLAGGDFEPLTVPVNDPAYRNGLMPEDALRIAANAGKGADNGESEPTGTRAGRADAGNSDAEATELMDGGNWTGDNTRTHIDPNPQPHYVFDDVDWFRVFAREKGNLPADYVQLRIENTAPPHATNDRRLQCMMWEPLSVYLNVSESASSKNYPIPGDNMGKVIRKDDSVLPQYYIDIEILNPGENGTLNAVPPITSYFYILLIGFSDIDINYNITSVSVTQVTPADKNNYVENSTIPQNPSVSGGNLEQHMDHWDWYDISAFIEYEGTVWKNKISYTVDLTSEDTGGGNYYSWVTAWVLYDSEDGQSLYINGDEKFSGGAMSRAGTDPIQRSVETEGTKAWLGIRVRSMIISSTSGAYLFTINDGRSGYDLSFSVSIVNTNPQLYQAKREPNQDVYYLEDDITFKVKYRDLDNNIPDYVRVSVDGTNFEMESTKTTYSTGVEFSEMISASDLGITPYPHVYNYSATDGLEHITLSLQSPNNEFKIIQNQTPKIFDSAPKNILLDEDADIYPLPMNQIFEDVDTTDGMDHYVRSGSSYGKLFESSLLKAYFSTDSKVLQIQLKANQHGSDEITVQAKETLKRGLDTYEFFSTHKFTVTVSPLNDKPALESIALVQVYQDDDITITVKASDPDIYDDPDPDKLTFSINRTNLNNPDFIDFKLEEINKTHANISFRPTNDHVGRFLLEVTVEDNNDAKETMDVEFEVLNRNDDPTIISISTDQIEKIILPNIESVEFSGKRSGAKEDEWFNMTVTIEDIDISIGEQNDIEFKIENSTLKTVINIDHDGGTDLTAMISILPKNEDVGSNYINLSVYDGKGGSAEITIEIKVLNVNDAPDIPIINKPADMNSTFSVVDKIQFEGQCDDDDFYIEKSDELLTYFWQYREADSSDAFQELDRGETSTNEKFSFFMKPLDRHIPEGDYVFRLVAQDSEKEKSVMEINVIISDDFDGDNLPDVWEQEYQLDHKDRRDALEDTDGDGFTNLEEYLGNDKQPGGGDDTNPRIRTQHPKKDETTVDNSWMIYVAIVVVIVVILIIVFLLIQRRKTKVDESELDNLAYPEEGGDIGFVPPMGQGPAPGGPGQGPGMPMQPGQIGGPMQGQMMAPGMGMGMRPGMPMQRQGMPPNMYQMRQMQMYQQTQGFKQPSGVPPGPRPQQGQNQATNLEGKSTSTGKSGQIDTISLKPQLPPGKSDDTENDALEDRVAEGSAEGRHSPLDSIADEQLDAELDIEDKDTDLSSPELVSGEPGFLSDEEAKELGITDDSESAHEETSDATSDDDEDASDDEIKCPNCGVAVKNGWFLCPGCKSPLN